MIGPLFNGAIADWPGHLDKLQAFWSSVMLTSGRYKGRPLPAHLKHGDRIGAASFERWLGLWKQTTAELFEPAPAATLQEKAERAESLQLGIRFLPRAIVLPLRRPRKMIQASATRLPDGLSNHRSTPLFTASTVPAALLRDHDTKDGVWALIVVHSGSLRYKVTDPRRATTTRDLKPGEAPGVVEPTILHHVEPIGAVEFQVDFYR